jgi:DNA-binding transcriptional regulator YiaG
MRYFRQASADPGYRETQLTRHQSPLNHKPGPMRPGNLLENRNMTPFEMKQWQADLGLSELAMAHYLGVPVHTLKKWENGTRNPDSATLRLFAILQRIGRAYPMLQGELLSEARASAPDQAKRPRGRPAKGTGAASQENAPQAPESPAPDIPAWLSSSV